MIYLDNSATTRKKPNSVISALISGVTTFSANPGRSGHKLSLETALEIAETREILKNYFGASKSENVIFTSGCTESLNLAILGTAKLGGHVITTPFEHNSVLRPLFELKKNGTIELTIIEPKNKHKICLDDIIPHVKNNTYLVATTHISNVDGSETEIEKIGNFCKNNNLLYLVDAAQSAGHKCINMHKCGINFLAIAGHKGLYSAQGIGVLLIEGNTLPRPIKFGGTGTESISVYQPLDAPECYESGTIATPNILSLKAGLEFVKANEKEIQNKEKILTNMLINGLNSIKNVIVYTNIENLNGVVAFNVVNYDSNETSAILNEKFNICVRGGLHCAPLKHKNLNTIKDGAVRASVSYFTTEQEVKKFLKAIQQIASVNNV